MMKKIKLVVFFFFFVFIYPVSAQVTAYYRSEELTSIYSIVNEKKNTNFFFPVYNNFPSQKTAYRVTKSTKIYIPEKIKTQFKQGLSLSLRYYTKNIAQIHLHIVTNDNKRRELINNINPADGYGLPSIINFENIKYLKEIDVEFEIKDKEIPFDLVFSSLDLVRYKIKNEISPSSIFQKNPFDNKTYSNQFNSKPFQSNGELAYFPKAITYENLRGRIDVQNEGKRDINDLLIEAVLLFLEDYPFYDVKKIDRNKFLISSKIFLEKCKDLPKCDLVDSINSYLSNTVNDPHFKIRSTCEKPKKNTPVYVYQIDGKYVVSAILDEELQKKIPLGSEILKINGDSFLNKNLSFKEVNEELLKNTIGSNVVLEIMKPTGEFDDIDYCVKDKYEISEKFNPKNLYVKKINDSLAYLKINKITYDLNIAYLNNYELIEHSKGLILDLRGCTGGDFLAASQFLSYFISGEFVLFNYGDGNDIYKYPVIVSEQTNISYNYNKNGKVVILVDESTACVSEMIVHALVKYRRENTKIVSKSKHTAGALSFAYEVNLPEGITIVTNALGDKRKIFLDDSIIEDKGIEPDILIDIKSVEDLQPYKDKVLEKAIFNLIH